MSNPRHILYFILISLFWGGSFLAIRIAVEHFPPFFAAFIRSSIAMSVIGFYLLWKQKKIPKSKLWLQSFGSGLFMMGVAWIFLFWGEKYVSPAIAAILNGTVPIFTTLLLPLVTPQDKLTWNKWAGVLIGFLGIVVIFFPEISLGMSLHSQGLLAILMMSVCYAIGTLWTRRLSKRVNNSTNLFYQCFGSATVLLLSSAIFELPHETLQWSGKALLALTYLGLFSSAISLLLFFVLVKDIGSVQASAVTYCPPLVAIILDVIFLNKWITWNQAIGAVVILGAVFLINRRVRA
ncbi:MAG: hypothetical protein A3F82_03575 [Deltaproteobacteria bacterium RIFCSPLOWO2_12_FULL_44_12]|nr:MAG: hypothetical protein A2712_05555 [Deltaproteobacteria bacterium RIFCSPHIGHO2_01_FULL_43_49]OGQ14331.1 MAG: hypothetical protein A3D22_04830 [Deltaproteobacteria bacterium RIFCSPHIGHO2_02_FULL_44_53]OGQ27629.1 MAG: hypothetical protein A3D98_09345 [Deltaproteobacteria bacterium RIFCSPHIGHO2_12_FULL_44_21]OGQ30772.1 MAG: hypothetical protein A2979_01240 [Deltaproteobacteria bacterium RIFCSPLOWO2_01_FULL_45_74]OGQ42452.1 MAG: hypothetical protein A3I70_10765 [Deltaproteobacteria bacterium 